MRWLASLSVVLGVALIASSQATSTAPADLAAPVAEAPGASSPSASSAPASLASLEQKAEATMKLGSVEKRPQVAAVFRYADALAQAGQDEEAVKWYEKGLTIHAWALPYQMKYAQLLMKQGNEPLAIERAKLVAENAEQGDLVVEALTLMGKEADVTLAPLEQAPGTGPAVVLMATGDVDVLLLKQVHKQLQSTFDFPIYLRKADVTLPPPDRDPYLQYLVKLRSSFEHYPGLTKLLKQQDMKPEDLKDDAKLMELTRKTTWARSGQEGLREFDAACTRLKSSEKQWTAANLLRIVQEAAQPVERPHVRFLGITRLDITEGDSNYLFSLQGGHFGIVSYRRFMSDKWGEEVPRRSRLADRLAKQCTSSIGRVFGISPCGNPTCVAAYPNSVEELDAKTSAFCPECQKKLAETIAREREQ